MRLRSLPNDEAQGHNTRFAELFLELGEGQLQRSDYASVDLTGIMKDNNTSEVTAAEALIEFVYPDLAQFDASDQIDLSAYLNGHCILAPLNRDVRLLNDSVLAKFLGDVKVSTSTDVPDSDGFDSLPEEVLNKFFNFKLP
jgi:hypothetical protein